MSKIVWRHPKLSSGVVNPEGHWIGRLGKIDVALVEEHRWKGVVDYYDFGVCLPRKADKFGDIDASTRTWGYQCQTLEGAKKAAEIKIAGWLKRAGLGNARAEPRSRK